MIGIFFLNASGWPKSFWTGKMLSIFVSVLMAIQF